jgi:hypothetical protein
LLTFFTFSRSESINGQIFVDPDFHVFPSVPAPHPRWQRKYDGVCSRREILTGDATFGLDIAMRAYAADQHGHDLIPADHPLNIDDLGLNPFRSSALVHAKEHVCPVQDSVPCPGVNRHSAFLVVEFGPERSIPVPEILRLFWRAEYSLSNFESG